MQKKANAQIVLTMVIAAVLSCTAACSKKEAPPEEVDKAATVFFDRLAKAEYPVIYNDAAVSFKKNNSQSQVYDTLKQMAELGKPGEPSRISMTFDNQEGKRIAIPTYHVLFDGRRITVIFQYVDEDGAWKLGGYEVRQRAG